MRVLLVSMPFASVRRPTLGATLLQASLAERSIACDIAYLNVAFAKILGAEEYEHIADELPHTTLAGEWVFSRCLYGSDRDPGRCYVDDVLRGTWHLRPHVVELIQHARALAPGFVRDCVASIPWRDYDVVGFSSAYSQNIASLALARSVKEECPSVFIAFGGHNWADEMGCELMRHFPFVDFACLGEGDVSFPALVQRLGADHARRFDDVPGMVCRVRGGGWVRSSAKPLRDLDVLPVPDYRDYFEALSHNGFAGGFTPAVPVETSRGCWWAAKRPCRFCGVNGSRRTYRTKSAGRIVWELRELARRYAGSRLLVVDSVVSRGFLSDVLPQLGLERLPVPISFAARADIGCDDVRGAAAAGATIMSGIESLSDHLLALMGKGTTSLENVRLLKWCATHGVRSRWNLLYGFPGETSEDYEDTLALLPAVKFLGPPETCGPLLLERFSPYFEHPLEYGFRRVRPLAAYRYIYPFSQAALREIAYFFDFEREGGGASGELTERLRREVFAWQIDPTVGRLRSRVVADGRLVLRDTRPGAASREVPFEPLDQVLYEACNDICTREEIRALAREVFRDAPALDEVVDRRLSSFVERRLMLTVDDRFLSLAVADAAATRESSKLAPR